MRTTVKLYSEKTKQRVKISTINHKKGETQKKKIKQKTTILLKTKIAITPTTQKNQQNWKLYSKHRDKTIKSKRIIDTSHISSDTHHSTPKSCLIIRRQQAVHSGQLSLQLKDLTVQAANLREDCVLLVSILQHHVVVLQIPHIGLQLLNASLDVQPSVLQLRLLQQRLLVLQVPTLPIPPVTNMEKLNNL
jgi:hypothetical protein